MVRYFLYLPLFFILTFHKIYSQENFLINSYGVPGIIDIPSAGSLPDGSLTLSSSKFGPNLRNTISFQALPRASLSFRYSGIGDVNDYSYSSSGYTTWDRSFDLRLDLLKENKIFPSITAGFQDIIGTGIFSGEYLVFSKSFLKKLRLTSGLGWGRLASKNTIYDSNVNRSTYQSGEEGGKLRIKQIYRGNIGVFGGGEFLTPIENLKLKMEVSSDSYVSDRPLIKSLPSTNINLGLNYDLGETISISSQFVNGNEIGLQMNIKLSPERTSISNYLENAPQPFYSIPNSYNENTFEFWDPIINDLKSEENISTLAYKSDEKEVLLVIENLKHSTNVKTIGRALRILSRHVPRKYTMFTVVLSSHGLPVTSISIERKDIENIIDAPNAELLTGKVVKITSSPKAINNMIINDKLEKFNFALTPYYRLHLFDPDKPIYYDLGPELHSSWKIKQGLVIESNISASAVTSFDKIQRGVKGNLPKVRTNLRNYLVNKGPRVDYLTLSSYYRSSKNLYGRFTLGLLENMYAGLSSELLRFDPMSNLSYGLELNFVKGRSFDQRFKLREVEGLSNINGHASLYWDTNYYNYLAQIDFGKFLAGDKGGTLKLTRDFPNGWKVGGFFTLTDATFSDFGEGSFDKGFFFSIPFNSLVPYESRSSFSETIRPIQGDGGARLSVNGRMYEMLKDKSYRSLQNSWYRIWQ